MAITALTSNTPTPDSITIPQADHNSHAQVVQLAGSMGCGNRSQRPGSDPQQQGGNYHAYRSDWGGDECRPSCGWDPVSDHEPYIM